VGITGALVQAAPWPFTPTSIRRTDARALAQAARADVPPDMMMALATSLRAAVTQHLRTRYRFSGPVAPLGRARWTSVGVSSRFGGGPAGLRSATTLTVGGITRAQAGRSPTRQPLSASFVDLADVGSLASPRGDTGEGPPARSTVGST
jgi:hypothetical protein